MSPPTPTVVATTTSARHPPQTSVPPVTTPPPAPQTLVASEDLINPEDPNKGGQCVLDTLATSFVEEGISIDDEEGLLNEFLPSSGTHGNPLAASPTNQSAVLFSQQPQQWLGRTTSPNDLRSRASTVPPFVARDPTAKYYHPHATHHYPVHFDTLNQQLHCHQTTNPVKREAMCGEFCESHFCSTSQRPIYSHGKSGDPRHHHRLDGCPGNVDYPRPVHPHYHERVVNRAGPPCATGCGLPRCEDAASLEPNKFQILTKKRSKRRMKYIAEEDIVRTVEPTSNHDRFVRYNSGSSTGSGGAVRGWYPDDGTAVDDIMVADEQLAIPDGDLLEQYKMMHTRKRTRTNYNKMTSEEERQAREKNKLKMKTEKSKREKVRRTVIAQLFDHLRREIGIVNPVKDQITILKSVLCYIRQSKKHH